MTNQVFHILLSLADEPKHGYAIIADIRDRTAGEVLLTASTLYDALARLVDQGLIAGIAPLRSTHPSDRRRRYYSLTTQGRRAAEAEAARLARVLDMARAKRFLA